MSNQIKNIAIGVFIGGNHIACAAVNLHTQEIIPGTYHKGMIENDSSSGLILMLWTAYIKKTIKAVGSDKLVGIGISTPGPFDYVNGIASFKGVPKYEELDGVNIITELSKRLNLENDVKIRFINDAIGFAIGEEWRGMGKGYSKFMSIILGEGFGSAFLNNGIPIIEGSTVPEKGIVYNIPYNGGIADDYFSARGLLNAHEANDGMKFTSVKSLAKFTNNDARVLNIFNDFGFNLANFLLPIIRDFNSDIIVFGGSVSDYYDLFKNTFENQLASENCNVNIETVDTNDYSFIYGGARLLKEEYWNKIEPILPGLD